MPALQINSLRSLKNAPVLEDLSSVQTAVTFNRWNLVYGFNGSGKTTLSRLFDSIANAKIADKLPPNVEFSFSLSDGTRIGSDDLSKHDPRMISVFNEDYVERSLLWAEGTATPIVYIGDEKAEQAKVLALLEEEVEKLVSQEQAAAEDAATSSKIFKDFCTAQARLIGEELGIARNYNAANLKRDFTRVDLTQVQLLDENERAKLKGTINQSDLPPKITQQLEQPDIEAMMRKVAQAQEASIPQLTLESLERRKDAIPWIKEGIRLHAEEKDCLLCGKSFSQQRRDDLTEAVSEGFEEFARIENELIHEAAKVETRCQAEIRSLTASTKSIPTLVSEFSEAEEFIRDLLGRLVNAASAFKNSANERLSDPSKQVTFPNFDAHNWSDALNKAHVTLSELIKKNNASIDNFDTEIEEARSKLKNHHLKSGENEFSEKHKLSSEDSEAREEFEKAIIEKRKEIREIRDNLSNTALAATVLNAYLESYLGHREFRLEEAEGGYIILRNGLPSDKTLSEGEKTAVAFCHFLVSLRAEGREIKDTIVVIDDPISSLDTRALGHVASIIKRELDQSAQLFILTHNIDFMRETKKWLYNRYKKDPSQASFLFTEHHISLDGERSTRIVKLPKLIREYESEYHYLYSVVKQIADHPNEFDTFAYLVPNAIRKVLDIFLAFKVPGGSGLSSKVDQIISSNADLDGNRIKAMERLAQTESHSESIGDTTTFSAFTLEQISEAASTLRHLIEKVDAPHHKAMDKLCG